MADRIIVPANNLKARVAVWSAVTGRRQCELASELGIGKSMLSQMLNGYKSPEKHAERIIELTKIA